MKRFVPVVVGLAAAIAVGLGFFLGAKFTRHDEPIAVAAMRVTNPDCSPFGIHR